MFIKFLRQFILQRAVKSRRHSTFSNQSILFISSLWEIKNAFGSPKPDLHLHFKAFFFENINIYKAINIENIQSLIVVVL